VCTLSGLLISVFKILKKYFFDFKNTAYAEAGLRLGIRLDPPSIELLDPDPYVQTLQILPRRVTVKTANLFFLTFGHFFTPEKNTCKLAI
jgi:hypothetical protein